MDSSNWHCNGVKSSEVKNRKRLAGIFRFMVNMLQFLPILHGKVVWSLPSDIWPGGSNSTPWIQILHFNYTLFSDSVAFRKSLPASSFSEDDSFETSSYGKAESIGSAGSLAIRSNSSSGGHSSASGQSTEGGTTIESKTLCIQTSINRAKNKSAECTNGTSEDASYYFWHLRNISLKLGAF